MRNLDESELDLILGWDDALAAGDHSSDARVLALLRERGLWDGTPVLFWAPRSAEGVELALSAGVDFAQRDATGQTVLFVDDVHEEAAYARIADEMARLGLIDATEAEGMTALSVQVKSGQIGRARALLQRGAAPHSIAHVARYGGAALSIPVQAVNVLPDPEASADDRDAHSIALLQLLQGFGLSVSPEERADLLQRTSARPALQEWIAANLPSSGAISR